MAISPRLSAATVVSQIFAVAVLCVGLPTAASASKRVAVLPITNSADLPSKQVLFLTQVVRQEGINTLPGERFQILTQANLEELLPPGKTLADCIDQCAIKTGKNLKAHYVITGQLQKAMQSYRLTLGLYGTRSGRYLEGLTVAASDILELEAEIKRRGRALYAALRTDAEGSRFALGGSGAIVVETKPPAPITMTKQPREREFVAFTSRPAGMDAFLDGRPVCRTPCQRVLPHGRYGFSLMSRCFESASSQLSIAPDGKRPTQVKGRMVGQARVVGAGGTMLSLVQRSLPLTVNVVVDDRGARSVTLNGLDRAKEISLSDGSGQVVVNLPTCTKASNVAEMTQRRYQLTVSAPGYVSVSRSFNGALPTWNVRLKRTPRLNLSCDDPKADIYLGKKKKGRGSVELDLPPGDYKASCGIPNAPNYTQALTLAAGDTRSLALTVSKVGEIRADCRVNQTQGAFIKIHTGENSTRVAWWRGRRGSKFLQGTIALPPGTYRVSCGFDGGAIAKREVQLKSAAVERVSLVSKTGMVLPTESGYSILGALPPNFIRVYFGLPTDRANELHFVSGYGLGGYEYRGPMKSNQSTRLGIRFIGSTVMGDVSEPDDSDGDVINFGAMDQSFQSTEESDSYASDILLIGGHLELFMDHRWKLSGTAGYSPFELNMWLFVGWGGIPSERSYDDGSFTYPEGRTDFAFITGVRVTQYLGVGPYFRFGPQIEFVHGSFRDDFSAALFGAAIEIPLWTTSGDRRFTLRGAFTKSPDGGAAVGVSWILKSMKGDTAFGWFK